MIKDLIWQQESPDLHTAKSMGLRFSVIKNERGKYNAIMLDSGRRPECEHDLSSINDAKACCQKMLQRIAAYYIESGTQPPQQEVQK